MTAEQPAHIPTPSLADDLAALRERVEGLRDLTAGLGAQIGQIDRHLTITARLVTLALFIGVLDGIVLVLLAALR